jgi:hypothetical protein
MGKPTGVSEYPVEDTSSQEIHGDHDSAISLREFRGFMDKSLQAGRA